MDMLDGMQTGRFKVFSSLLTGSRNFACTTARTGRSYLMAAARYGVMMLRFAEVQNRPRRRIVPRRAKGGWMGASERGETGKK